MKTAYLGKIQLSDVDLSYLHAAQRVDDVTYFLEVNPRFMAGPAFAIKEVARRDGVFKAVNLYPEFRKFEGFIDLDKFYVVNTYGRLWALKSLWVNLRLLFMLIRCNYSVVHLTWPLNVYEFALYALRRRMLLTVHDPFPHEDAEHDTFIVRLRRWCAFHLVPKFLILNKAQRHKFLSFYGLRVADVYDSRLSAYDYLTSVPHRRELAPSGRYILFAGKISQYKGVDYLLRAMVEVHRECPDCRLVVAGGGKFHFDVSGYEAEGYIEFRNRFITDEELVSLIRHSEFVVCPYTNATQSGVIMSAFAFAKPVIATEVGGLPEMLGHGELGVLVPPADAGALARGIAALLKDEERLERYAENIRCTYGHGNMSWGVIAEEIGRYKESAWRR